MTIACDPKYLHCPDDPDCQKWPFDVPCIMEMLKNRGLMIVNAGDQSQADIHSPIYLTWMDRALRAEADVKYITSASEIMIKTYEERLAKLEENT